MSTEGPRDTVEPLREAHTELHGLLNELNERMAKVDAEKPCTWQLDDVIAHLSRLHEHLAKHFKSEEESDLHGWFCELMPDEEPQVLRLRFEHRQLLKALDELRAWQPDGDCDCVVDLRKRIDRIVTTLQQHEALEDELMARTLRCVSK